MIFKILPIVLALGYALLFYKLSASRLKRELDQNSSELADPKLKPVLDKMARALDLPRIKVNIYEIDPVNGLAAPDGRIFITRGFYQKYQEGKVSAEELASVIAHELGHVALGHSKRRMGDFASQNAMRTALAMILSRFIPIVGAWVANFVMSLVMARMSRDDEFEADSYATALLLKSGIGVEPQVTLFEKLPKMTGSRGGAAPAWLLSHPKAEERIAAIEQNAEKWR